MSELRAIVRRYRNHYGAESIEVYAPSRGFPTGEPIPSIWGQGHRTVRGVLFAAAAAFKLPRPRVSSHTVSKSGISGFLPLGLRPKVMRARRIARWVRRELCANGIQAELGESRFMPLATALRRST